MILMSKSLVTFTKKTEILPQTLSDHNPVTWEGKEIKTKYQWKLKERVLEKEENMKKLKE